MALSSLANLAISTVATAPSPATSGTSLTVASGHGSRFPSSGSFPIVIWPTAANPDPSNAEIALCTAVSGDVLTITRAQEGSSARTVVVGDQVMMSVTKAVLDGMAANVQVFTASGTWTKPAGAKWIHVKVYNSGGGGGGGRRGAAASNRFGGGSGASGGWAEAILSVASVDSSCTVTVAAGGTAGAAATTDDTNGGSGGSGGQSKFTFNASQGLFINGGDSNAGGGGGGTASAGTAGSISTSSAMYDGKNGLSGQTSGSTGYTPMYLLCGPGWPGGGVSSSDAVGSGSEGLSAAAYYGNSTTPLNTVTPTAVTGLPGRGGRGGNGSKTAAGGTAGDGSQPGGGGGGGGGCLNGFNSGAGGKGGDGQVIVTTYF